MHCLGYSSLEDADVPFVIKKSQQVSFDFEVAPMPGMIYDDYDKEQQPLCPQDPNSHSTCESRRWMPARKTIQPGGNTHSMAGVDTHLAVPMEDATGDIEHLAAAPALLDFDKDYTEKDTDGGWRAADGGHLVAGTLPTIFETAAAVRPTSHFNFQ